MLVRILLLGLALWLILTVLKQYRRNIDRQDTPAAPEQDMVRCPVCQVHLPRAESIEKDGEHYCCVEHSQQHRP